MEIRVESPFPFAALPRVWRWIESFHAKVADDFAPKTLSDFVRHMGAKWGQQKTWAIYGDGELGGLITFERLNPWLGTAHMLLKPELQGRGLAVRALRVAFGEMFQQGIGKLVFFVLAGNLAVGSLVINVGAKREGTLEGHTLSDGRPRDVWVYGLSKAAFEEKHHVISIRTDDADQHIEREQPAVRVEQRQHVVAVEQHPDAIACVAADHAATPGVLPAVGK